MDPVGMLEYISDSKFRNQPFHRGHKFPPPKKKVLAKQVGYWPPWMKNPRGLSLDDRKKTQVLVVKINRYMLRPLG